MPADMRASRIMRDRRAILATLNMVYPGHMPGDELFRIVLDANPEYTRVFLIRDLKYFEEKRYVEYRGLGGIDAEGMSVRGCQFKLTAAGTDVANRLVKDPTLEV